PRRPSRMSEPAPAQPLRLAGDPYSRGRAQAALRPDLAEHVRHAIAHRLAETAGPLADPAIRAFIAAQHAATARLYPAILAEIDGIADGFAIGRAALFDYLHCSTAADLAAMPEHDPDGEHRQDRKKIQQPDPFVVSRKDPGSDSALSGHVPEVIWLDSSIGHG
ncbi:MAG TPA: hypothetical protein PKL48_15425, partial [Thermodesulfobacteriota bacterium]|nr:hypothetical protein [Thermodesulfobacteriota bacterium]